MLVYNLKNIDNVKYFSSITGTAILNDSILLRMKTSYFDFNHDSSWNLSCAVNVYGNGWSKPESDACSLLIKTLCSLLKKGSMLPHRGKPSPNDESYAPSPHTKPYAPSPIIISNAPSLIINLYAPSPMVKLYAPSKTVKVCFGGGSIEFCIRGGSIDFYRWGGSIEFYHWGGGIESYHWGGGIGLYN